MPNRTICLRVAEVVGEKTKAEFYSQLRKTFHSLFADHRITKDRELFTADPIKTWLRKRGAIAAGNGETGISSPKDSLASLGVEISNSSIRENASLKCDCSATCGEGVAT